MVEMVETAAILNQADERALVILDEIGRGTATYDGLSIAWATLEHLHEVNRCRALFATHYHELTALAGSLDGLDNATMRGEGMGGRRDLPARGAQRALPTDPTGCRWRSWPGFPRRWSSARGWCSNALEKGEREGGRGERR